MLKFAALYFARNRTPDAVHRWSNVSAVRPACGATQVTPREYAMKMLLLGVVAATAILGPAPTFAESREVRIIREYDRDWDRPPWARHFAWWRGGCRDITERWYRPDGTIEVRKVHRCD